MKDYAKALGVELPENDPAPAEETPADGADVDVGTNTGTDTDTDTPANDVGEDPAVDPNASAAARRRAMESRIEREREKARREARAEVFGELRRATAGNAPAASGAPASSVSDAPTTPARDSGGRFARRTATGNAGTAPVNPVVQPEADIDARIRAAVDSHPAVIAAGQLLEKARSEEVRGAFADEMAKITAMMPELKSEDDILALPEHDLILELVSKGYKPSDAVYSVFSDRITAAAVERGKRQAASAAASTSHLVPDKHRGSGGDVGVQVPADVREMYRNMMPGMSDADIAKHYGRFKKIE